MADGVEPGPPTSSGRRRQAGSESVGLSVADLLARHAAGEDDGLPAPRRVAPHRTPPAADDTDQFTMGPASTLSNPSGHHPLDAWPLDASPLDASPLGPSPLDASPLEASPLDASPLDAWPLGGRPVDPQDAPTELVPRAVGRGPEGGGQPSTVRIPEPNAGTKGPPKKDAPKKDAPKAGSADPEPTPDPEVVDAEGLELRARRIDESLVRLTAIHAGMGAEMSARVGRSSRSSKVGGGAKDGAGPPHGGDPDDRRDFGDLGGGPPRLLTRAGKVLLGALAVLLFIGTGFGWGAKNWLDAKLRSVAALDPNSESIVDKAGQYGDENYLLVGSDTRAGIDAGSSDAAREGTASGVPGARSDTVMVAHIPAKRDRVVLVSFPRDLEVDRPSCDRWDAAEARYPGGTAPAENAVKLNTAFEVGGPRCVTKVVQKLTGLSINHFTAIDFAGFKEMVDAVQGVPICLDRPVLDSVLGRVVPTAGTTVLAGDQALSFVRARHVRGDPTSDYGRIQRQQRFLSALMRRGLSNQVLLSPAKLRDFVTAFGSHTLSDNAGIDELTTLGSSLRSLDPARVTFITVPTVGEPNGAGNEVLRKSDTAALFTAIRSDQPLPGEARIPGGPGPGTADDDSTRVSPNDIVAPGQVNLAVRNGSSRAGLANEVADSLRTVGFTVSGVGDASPVAGGRTLLRFSPDRADQAATVAAAVPAAVSQQSPGPAGLLELVLGQDFDGAVKAPVGPDGVAPEAALPTNLSTVNGADASCR